MHLCFFRRVTSFLQDVTGIQLKVKKFVFVFPFIAIN